MGGWGSLGLSICLLGGVIFRGESLCIGLAFVTMGDVGCLWMSGGIVFLSTEMGMSPSFPFLGNGHILNSDFLLVFEPSRTHGVVSSMIIIIIITVIATEWVSAEVYSTLIT